RSPTPPRHFPAPQLSGTKAYSSTRTGCSASITSTGMLERFCEALVTASSPSLSGRPPQAPQTMSTMMKGLRLGLSPLMQMTLLPPSPAAGKRAEHGVEHAVAGERACRARAGHHRIEH